MCRKNACAVSNFLGLFFHGPLRPPRTLVFGERRLLFAHSVFHQMSAYRCETRKMSSQQTSTSKTTLRSRLPKFNFLKKAPKKVAETSKLDKDLANFVEKSISRKNSSTTDAAACSSVLSAKDKQNTNIKLIR